jgi:MFS family permease
VTTPTAEGGGFGLRFALVVVCSSFYFIGLGVLAPVLPRYVEHVLHGGGLAVGIAVGAFAVSAAAFRSWVGRVGDRRGRRILIVGGAAAVGVSVFAYGLDGLTSLVLMRLISGAGEAALFVGAATTAQDLAPLNRRGQAASLFSIAVYGGIAVGPPIGEWLYRHHGAEPVWALAGGLCLVAAAIGAALPDWVTPVRDGEASDAASSSNGSAGAVRRFLHPAAVRPGLVLTLGGLGYAGFSSFVPLYADRIGLRGAGPVFIEYAAVVLTVRIVGSRLPDVLGPRRGPLLALGLQASGLLVIGTWAAPLGLYAGTAVYAAGVSMLYPALFPSVVDAAPEAERSHAIGTFTLFFDLSQGLGALVLGAVVAATSEQRAFVAAGLGSAFGWWLHRRWAPAGAAGRGPSFTLPPAEPGE